MELACWLTLWQLLYICTFVSAFNCACVSSRCYLDKAAQWVNAENENRDKYLSAHEKKSLEAAQV